MPDRARRVVRIITVKPGPLTRMYFPDEQTANATDPVLRSVGESARRATLIAVPEREGQLRFDIHLQGDRETVFFDV